jgi:tRNA pseudouridine38-40 synthase
MPRYKLTIAYDGTGFCGWQKQHPPPGSGADPGKVLGPADAQGPRVVLRTVQEIVERAVREATREPVQLIGASRTDAGVHARGQVAAFSASDEPARGWPLERGTLPLLRAINSRLPEDVLVLSAEAAAPGFDPISGARSKGYSYTVHVSPHRPLWERHFVHHVWTPLDLAAMNEAAALLVGEHDFAAFAAAGHGRQSTIRTIHACRIVDEGPIAAPHQPDVPEWARRVRIEVSGNGFLWNMVRIIAGTLAEVGRGHLGPGDIAAALESGDRRRAGPTFPPTGLCLEWILYE